MITNTGTELGLCSNETKSYCTLVHHCLYYNASTYVLLFQLKQISKLDEELQQFEAKLEDIAVRFLSS